MRIGRAERLERARAKLEGWAWRSARHSPAKLSGGRSSACVARALVTEPMLCWRRADRRAHSKKSEDSALCQSKRGGNKIVLVTTSATSPIMRPPHPFRDGKVTEDEAYPNVGWCGCDYAHKSRERAVFNLLALTALP